MKKKYYPVFILIIFITFFEDITYGQSEEKKIEESYYFNEELWTRTLDPNLVNKDAFLFVSHNIDIPNFLLIGNSISIGYTPTVREGLAGVANLFRIPENGGDTYYFLENYEKWLSSVNWNIIHLNFGLHDLKRIDENGKRNSSLERNNSPEVYRSNLRKIFEILTSTTEAQIIWASTTFIPEGSEGRISGDEVLYNQIALEVLKDFPEIQINDLYTASLDIKTLQQKANVHYLEKGYEKLGTVVADYLKACHNLSTGHDY
ncbi:MAG: SGNH/GDSL hydrolase family protein [Bacteroidales bacterium]|nr:SGNH/GDSL hydrolase family protein [Bacteroidales bacterium]MCF8389581.1 SGNH/GDSL hydrolase family protein [Bacteroidales bacterium]